MDMTEPIYCELCGRPIRDPRKARRVMIEGAILIVCPQCYTKLVKQGKITGEKKQYTTYNIAFRQKTRRPSHKMRRPPRRILEEEFEIVPDYAERIRRARQKLGWSTKILAEKVGEKETVIKRIEAGRLKPSIELAQRLERILKIELLEPIIEETPSYSGGGEDYFTIGDLIKIRGKKK